MFKNVVDAISRYQLAIVFVALIAGFVVPGLFRPFEPYTSVMLMAIMFATGLRLDLRSFLDEARDWRTLVLAVAMMMVVLPFLVSIPLKLFAPEWILPFVLAAAMPTGLTAPAVMTIMGGKSSLTLLISIATSVSAPFFIPVILKVLLGETVRVDTLSMMLQIATVVALPLALAMGLRHLTGDKRIRKAETLIRLVNLIAFVLVIGAVTSTSSLDDTGGIANFYGIGMDGLIIIVLMLIFWAGIAWLASSMLAWRKQLDRLTVAFCLVYLNVTLAVWIADRFFPETRIAPKLVVMFVAINIALPVFKHFIPVEKRPGYKRVYAVEQT